MFNGSISIRTKVYLFLCDSVCTCVCVCVCVRVFARVVHLTVISTISLSMELYEYCCSPSSTGWDCRHPYCHPLGPLTDPILGTPLMVQSVSHCVYSVYEWMMYYTLFDSKSPASVSLVHQLLYCVYTRMIGLPFGSEL